jgi:hypothetical protein
MSGLLRGPAVAAIVLASVACSAEAGDSRTLTLRTLNESGVTGSVTLTELTDGQTRVTVDVDPAGHPNMPAHIHPGTCAELIPQPKYPLQSVIDGESTTDVAASLQELLADSVALNLHASNSEMDVYTACIELGTAPASASSSPAPRDGPNY